MIDYSFPTPHAEPVGDSAPTNYQPMESLHDFHTAFGHKQFVEEDDYGRQKIMRLRLALIQEEFREVADEILDSINGSGNLAALAKELADLLYVVYGTAAVLDLPMYEIFQAVHASNMSKLGPDGKPVYRNDGKILKGPNYFDPDIESIISSAS